MSVINLMEKKSKIFTVSVSLNIPETLHDKVKLDAMISRRPVSTMVEELAKQLVSPHDVTVSLDHLMQMPVKEQMEPGVPMKTLTLQISRRHHSLIRLERLRQNTTISSLLWGWLREHTREWHIEPWDQDEVQDQAA